MQIFTIQNLEVIEIALDDLHAKYMDVLNNGTISDLQNQSYNETLSKFQTCEQLRKQIHQDKMRLQYQQLKINAKNQ